MVGCERTTQEQRDDVDVAGRPAGQAEGKQAGAADDDELDSLTTYGKLFAERREQLMTSAVCPYSR